MKFSFGGKFQTDADFLNFKLTQIFKILKMFKKANYIHYSLSSVKKTSERFINVI